MMLITAIVAPSRLAAIRRALGAFGVHGMTRANILVETGTPRVEFYRGVRRAQPDVSRVRLDLLTTNADTADMVRVIRRASDGVELQLWVTRVDHLVRIRTGETGLDAL